MTITQRFAVLRDIYVSLAKQRDVEAAAEHYAETAWLRAAEYDPEAQDQMYREDMMCLS